MSTMIGIWRDFLYWLGIAAQLIRHNDTWLTVLPDQSGEKTLGSLCVTACLNQNIKNIAICVNGPPKPILLSPNRDDNLINVPFVVWLWSIPADTVRKMTTKAINPETNGFPADNDAALGKQVFHIGRAQRKPVIGPYCISDNLTRKTKSLQPGKRTR